MQQSSVDTRQHLAPYGPEVFIHRPRVEALYNKARNGGYIVAAAPAGFGKTVTTSHWARESGRIVTWLTVDQYDNAPGMFYKLFCSAVMSVQPENARMRQIFLDPLFASAPVDYAIRMLMEFRDDGRNFVLVLDDVHSITDNRILAALPHLFRRLPQSFLVVLITRDSRGEPYGQLMKEGAVLVDSEDLCFTEDELLEYFRSTGSQAPALEVEGFHHTTGGWPIGVVALSAMLGLKEPVSGADLMERYFTGHLWPGLDEQTKRFILAGAVTDEVSGDLARRLTGDDDAEKILAKLYADGFFMTQCLDGTFFFHRIILDLIRERPEFAAQDLDRLYSLAAEFYRSQKEFFKAWHYAHLSRNIRTIIDTGFPSILTDCNSFEEIKKYADACLQELVPEDLCEKAPFLHIINAVIAYFAADPERFARSLDKLYENWEAIAETYPQTLRLYYFTILKDHRRPYHEICEWAEENISGKKRNDIELWGISTLTCNMPHLHRGTRDFSELTDKAALQRCMRINRALSENPATICAYYRTVSAGLLLEQNRLEEALSLSLLHVAEMPGNILHEIRFASMMVLASIYEAMGNSGEYVHVMREIEKYSNGRYIFLRPNFLALKTGVRLCRGDRDAAENWLENYFIHSTRRLKLHEIPLYFTTLRSLILLGRLDDAQVLVTLFRKLLTGFRRTLDLASLDTLDAIIKWNKGQQDEAVDLLADVMRRMRPYGFTLPIAAEGSAVAPILKRLLMGKKNAELTLDREYIQKVQVHVSQRARRYKGIACHLAATPRRLSKQQKMTLSMLAKGMSAREIARTTGLTIHTVKWHSKEAYSKLQVNNIFDAVTKARALGYID